VLELATLGPALLAAVVNFVLLAVVFGPLEHLLPAQRQRHFRTEWATDLLFFVGQYLVFGVVAVAMLSTARQWLESLPSITGGAAFTPDNSSASLARCAVAVLIGDLLVYWFHRACHSWPLLWRFHRVHHSSTALDWLAAHREHPVDGWLTQLCQNAPALLLGVRVEYLAGLVLFRNAWAIFIHSNVRVQLGPLRYLLGAPDLHHYHHACVEHTRHNFANLAPWLDVVFGTYHCPGADETYRLGNPEPHARGYLLQLLEPLTRPRPRA